MRAAAMGARIATHNGPRGCSSETTLRVVTGEGRDRFEFAPHSRKGVESSAESCHSRNNPAKSHTQMGDLWSKNREGPAGLERLRYAEAGGSSVRAGAYGVACMRTGAASRSSARNDG